MRFNFTELGSKFSGSCHGKTGGGWWWYTLTYNCKFWFWLMIYLGRRMKMIIVWRRILKWRKIMFISYPCLKMIFVVKNAMPTKQIAKDFGVIWFFFLVWSSMVRRLHRNFIIKYKTTTLQNTRPKPFFKTLKVWKTF